MDLYYIDNTLYINLIDKISIEDKEYLKKRIENIINDYNVEKIVFEKTGYLFSNRHFLKDIKHMYANKMTIK